MSEWLYSNDADVVFGVMFAVGLIILFITMK